MPSSPVLAEAIERFDDDRIGRQSIGKRRQFVLVYESRQQR
jgi:hypothetical protein